MENELYSQELLNEISKNLHILCCPYCGKKMFFDTTLGVAEYEGVEKYRCEIPTKIPSLNEYIDACRTSRRVGAKFKRDNQELVTWFVKKLPKFDKPITIHFHWIEGNERRDQDNVTGFGHKVLLDALVACGKVKDDNKKYILRTSDDFEYVKGEWGCVMYIEVVDEIR